MSQGLLDAQNKADGVTLNGAEELVINGLPAAYPMPKFSSVLTDQQVADVLTFVRSDWNNASTAVSASEVAKLPEATAHALK
jgi:mono/diheme cytochrome c family protein